MMIIFDIVDIHSYLEYIDLLNNRSLAFLRGNCFLKFVEFTQIVKTDICNRCISCFLNLHDTFRLFEIQLSIKRFDY